MIFLRKKKLLATATSRPQRNFSTKLPATLPIPCCLIRSQCSVPIEATVAARKAYLLPQIHKTMNLWPINRSTTGVYQRKTDEHGDKLDKPNWSCVIHARFSSTDHFWAHKQGWSVVKHQGLSKTDHFQYEPSHLSKHIEVLVDGSQMAQQVFSTKLALIQPIQLRLKTTTSKFQPVQASGDRKWELYALG